MFKKISNLTYNELVKQFKKTSIKVIIALIMISAILLPIGLNMFNLDSNAKYIKEGNSINLSNSESQLEASKNNKTEAGKILSGILEIEKQYYQMMKDNKVGYNEWREEELLDYKRTAIEIFAIKQILNGANEKVLLDNLYNIDTEEVKTFYEMSKEDLNKKLDILTKENEERKNIVDKNEYIKYLNKDIKRKEDLIKEDKKTIDELEKDLKNDPNNEELKLRIKDYKSNILTTEDLLQVTKYRYENKIDFEESNWRNKTLKNIEEYINEVHTPMLTEKQYNSNAKPQNVRMTYEDYKKEYENRVIELKQSIEKDWYSLKNNVPQLKFVKDARTIISSIYDIYIILAVIMVIIVGGGIVSSEFSSGTIRLLMIRPVSRGKILLSKFLSVLIIGFGVFIISIIVLTISSGVIFGFETLKIPVIEIIGGVVTQVSYMKYLLSNILISSAGLVFISCLVFMISTLARNTAIAVAVSMLLYLGAMPLTMLLASLKMTWISSTIIPYINQSIFNLSPYLVEALKVQQGIRLNPSFGAIQLIVVSIIMIIITFITFIKKDIKN